MVMIPGLPNELMYRAFPAVSIYVCSIQQFSPVSCVSDPKPGLRESGLGCRIPQRAMMSAPSEILIRITSSYGLRIKTEIPRMYDEARVLAPETARLWQDLLSVDIERADMVLVIDLG